MQKFLATLTGPKDSHLLGSESDLDFGIRPVALGVQAVPSMNSEEVNGVILRFVDEPAVSSNMEGITFERGVAVVEALRKVQIFFPEGRVDLARGAVVRVSALNGTYRVINIVDTTRDAVTLHVCRRHIALAPGHEGRFSLDKAAVAAAAVNDGCGRRNEQDDSCCTYAIKVSEVSVAGLLKHDPIGRQIYLGQSVSERRLAQRILKVSAALALSTKSKTPYGWN